MQVVILAGGLGTRLRPLTEVVPKPMVPVRGRPFLDYLIQYLAAQGFRRFLLLVGYLGGRVQDHYGDGSGFGVNIEYAWEETPLGTGGALRRALSLLENDFLLLYGDSFLPIDYRPLTANFLSSGLSAMVVVYDNRIAHTGVKNNVAIGDCGLVTCYRKGVDAPDLQYVEAGALCLRREVIAPIPEGAVVSLEEEVFPSLIARRQLGGAVTSQRFFDIGTPSRLEEFSRSVCSFLEHPSA
jgi:NDP-sugar pyrophosphorylase family protein